MDNIVINILMLKFNQFISEGKSDILPVDVRAAVKSKGGKIYQIGGAVRDELLGKISKDLDILVVGIEMSALGTLLRDYGKVNEVGKSFGILKFVPEGEKEEIDISVPRVDEKSTGKGHKDFVVKLGGDITLKQDQLRRDFWMNAIAKDIDTGKLWDLDGKGLSDIKNKEVRMISPTAFEDDPLRMLRAVQFASRFGFSIERETLREIRKNAPTISSVSPDRFQEEFRKMYEKSDKPSIGANLLYTAYLMKHIFPKCAGVPKIIDNIPKGNFPTFLAILLNGAYGVQTKSILQSKMRLSNKDAIAAQEVTNWMLFDGKSDKVQIVKFSKGLSPEGLKGIDAYQSSRLNGTLSLQLKRLPSLKTLKIKGNDLTQIGLKGRSIGDALDYALEIAIRAGKNNKEYLMRQVKKKYQIKEEVKVESVLKATLTPYQVRQIIALQKEIKDKEMINLKPKDLHITLISGEEWKMMRKDYKGKKMDDIGFRIDFESPKRVEGGGGRVSWYTRIVQQKQMHDYVKGLIGIADKNRVYHVSIANKTGRTGDSVGVI